MDWSTLLPAIGTFVITLLVLIARFYIKASKYEAAIKAVAKVAYPLVKSVADQTSNKIDDQIAAFLKALNAGLEDAGLPPVDPEKAKALFEEMAAKEAK